MFPDERQVLPCPEPARGDFRDPLRAQLRRPLHTRISSLDARVDLLGVVREFGMAVEREGLLAMTLHEYRVRETDVAANALQEGQVRRLDIMWAPAEEHRVEGDDERGEARGLDTVEERDRHVVVPWPAGSW